jgi:outer membrane protein assembly factor BamB
MFRGYPVSPGVISTGGVERLGGVAWRFDSGAAVRSSPVIADGVVYFGTSGGEFFALDSETGSVAWSVRAGAPISGAALVTEARVVFVDRGNRIHAVDRATGEAAWRVDGDYDLPLTWGWEGWDYLLSSPVLAGSLVIVGLGDGYVYAVNLENGRVQWRFKSGGRIRSAAAIHDGVAYVSSGDGVVYGVSVVDGSEVWRFETNGKNLSASDWGFDRTQIYSSPTIVDGALFFGSRDATVYAIDLESREPRWTFEDGTSWVMSSPAVADGRVFSARSSNGQIRAVDVASGLEQWVVKTGGMVFSSPMVVDSTVYVGSGDANVYALDASTGSVRWTYHTGGGVFSTPTIWDGRLYVGSDNGFLYAFEATEGSQPRVAVYWDDDWMAQSIWGREESHRVAADYFRGVGYESLDAVALEEFLRQRAVDKIPSAVVVAMDAIPGSVASIEADSTLFRRYLDSGGKIVWLGLPPLLLERNAEGNPTGVNRDHPSRLLSVSHRAWDSDEFGVTVTEVGRKWGLRKPWVGMPGVAATEAVDVLAVDAIGRAAMWVKNYGGSLGTGFVFGRMDTNADYLEELRQVVEYGVLRRAIPHHDGCRPNDGRC